MTRFDVQQGKIVGGAVPVAPIKNPQKSHAFILSRCKLVPIAVAAHVF